MKKGLVRRLLNRIHRPSRGEPALTSPREMALQNAAEALGEQLGDYYVDEWEVPDKDLAEAAQSLPPEIRDRIDARREEAVLYVRREGVRRRRRRIRRALTVAVLVGAVVAVGKLLNASPRDAKDDARPIRIINNLPPSMRRQPPGLPAPSGNSISATASRRGQVFVNSSYVGAHGGICSALATVRDGVSERHSSGGCTPPVRLSRELARLHAVFIAVSVRKEAIVLRGYASSGVQSIRGRGWPGEFAVGLSRAWTPEAGGLDELLPRMPPFRTFVALARPDFGANGRQSSAEGDRALDYESYELKARLSDGRVVKVVAMPPSG